MTQIKTDDTENIFDRIKLINRSYLMEPQYQLLAQRIYTTSNIRGNFILRSGVTSTEYFDKYLFEAAPELLRDIAEAMIPLIPAGVDALAGLELGGVPLATMLSQLTGLPALFVRKQAKTYGTCKLAEGGEITGRKLLIVEDVVTTGGQIIDSARKLREIGAQIIRVLCVIDREQGGAANLQSAGLEFCPLLTMSEINESVQEESA